MEENNQQPDPEDFLKNLPLQAEEIGFKNEELIVCESCSRRNPPNRLKCLYCGRELEISAEQTAKIAPVLRKLESWENGFNLIYSPASENVDAEKISEIARLIGLERELLQNILDVSKPLPLVRAETPREAEILQNRLREFGVETFVVGDKQLAAETAPKRLRGLEIEDGRLLLILFNSAEIEEVFSEDLVLLVSGAIFEKSIVSTEARKKGQTKILDATETASDELLVDIFSRRDAAGYRILIKGFDFSCLGAEKGMLARDNIKKLIARLQSLAPNAKLVDDYLSVRNLLGAVWEVEQRRDSQGLTRQRFGKFDLSNVSTSNNLHQFTKYSRLQWNVL